MSVVFDRAGAQATGLRARRFAEARANSRAVIETPNLAGYDEGTEAVRCTGVLHIVLTPGPGAPAGRGADISAPVQFDSTPDPEGDGVRYAVADDAAAVGDTARSKREPDAAEPGIVR